MAGENAQTRCPKCSGAMALHAFSEQISLLRCRSCHGMLIGEGMIARIRTAVRADEFFDIGHPKVGRALDTLREYACPACGGEMRGSPDEGQSHIFVERCASCRAVFLDAGELIDLSHDTPLERVWAVVVRRLGLG